LELRFELLDPFLHGVELSHNVRRKGRIGSPSIGNRRHARRLAPGAVGAGGGLLPMQRKAEKSSGE
jgi:hypothetical protein